MSHHQDFISATHDLLVHELTLLNKSDANASVDIKLLTKNMVRNVLFKVILGIDEFPYHLHKVFDSCTELGFDTNLEKNPLFQNTKFGYGVATKILLVRQIDNLTEIFKNFPNGKSNLIADSIIDLIKEENPGLEREKLKIYINGPSKNDIIKYSDNAYIKTLPLILIAGENLINTISTGILKLSGEFFICFTK